MANFAPLKNRLLAGLDENLEVFDLRGRVLDYGAGSADVIRHVLAGRRFEEGVAYDPSYTASDLEAGSRMEGMRLACGLEEVGSGFDLALLFDVIEHLPEPEAALREVHSRVVDNGWLVATVPYNAREWGEDDEFYGHLRRLSREGVINLFERSGWDVIRVLDPSFPTFWLMRRAYLLASGLIGGLREGTEEKTESDIQRSLASSRKKAWDNLSNVPERMAAQLLPWKMLRRFDLYFESLFLGFELFVVCQRRQARAQCETCGYGLYSNGAFFDRYSLQVCGYCSSERILPGKHISPAHARDKILPAPVESLRSWLRPLRVRSLAKLPVPERSVLEFGSGNGRLLQAFRDRGWRTLGLVSSERVAARVPEGAGPVEVGGLDSIRESRFGLLSLFHMIESSDDLDRTFEEVDRLLLPGGYLALEYPNGRSLLRRVFGWRWFGYDPPNHRLVNNPVALADRLGLSNYRMVAQSYFSPEYSFLSFAQTIANVLLPFHRDALFGMLLGRRLGVLEGVLAVLTGIMAIILLPLFAIYQPIASALGGGCIVRQVFKKGDFGTASDPEGVVGPGSTREGGPLGV